MSDLRWWELGKDSFDLSGTPVDEWIEAFDGAIKLTFDAEPAKVTCCCGALGENLIDWAGWRPVKTDVWIDGSGRRFKMGRPIRKTDGPDWRDQEWLCDTCYRWLMGYITCG